jgi:hypothetical protein
MLVSSLSYVMLVYSLSYVMLVYSLSYVMLVYSLSYVMLVIVLTCALQLHDCIISPTAEAWAHNISLTLHLY